MGSDMTIKHNCRNGCYVDTQTPDWSFTKGAFKNENIVPSDMDGWVEINGNLLMIEWKRTGAELPLGQAIAFEKLTRKGQITVIVVYGNPQTSVPESLTVYKNGETIVTQLDTNQEHFCRQLSNWEKSLYEF
jgi:hypothetical protein